MDKFVEYIKELYHNGFGAPVEYWLIVLLLLLLVLYIGVKLFNISKNKESNKGSLYFGICLTNIKLLCFTLGIILLSSIILFVFFYQDYFVKQHFALDFIILIFGLSLSIIITLFRLNKGVKTELPKYIKPSLSIIQKVQHGNYLSNTFEKSKWRVICIILPFTLLLLHFLVKPEAEVSILIDNSGSTNTYREYGKQNLAEAIEDVYDETKFNVSYFETFENVNCETKNNSLFKDANKIVQTSEINNLSGENIHFNSSNESSVFFRNNNIEHSCLGTPLLETIWSNYLYSIQYSSKKNNVIRILILLTDGEGNLYAPTSENNSHTQVPDDFDIFDKTSLGNDLSMSDYYDEISIINIGNNEAEPFFNNYSSNIYNGQDKDSYKQSLKSVTEHIQKRNWNFIFILASLSLIVIITSLSIKIRPVYKQNK